MTSLRQLDFGSGARKAPAKPKGFVLLSQVDFEDYSEQDNTGIACLIKLQGGLLHTEIKYLGFPVAIRSKYNLYQRLSIDYLKNQASR